MQAEQHGTSETVPIPRRVIISGFVSTFIEWYDFLVYGIVAALVFNQLFFPNADPFVGTLASLATFAVGFVARPVGGIVFGHFGDRIGRRTVLVLTLLIMGVATTAIGLLPTYASIGIWAPILLTVFRFAQGLSVGGEWGGVALLLVESSPADRRGRVGSWAQIGGYLGPLAGTILVAIIVATTTEEQFLSWGWRIPFLVSIALVAVGIWVRLRLGESQAFEKTKQERKRDQLPLVAVFRESRKSVLCIGAIHAAEAALLFVGLTFMPGFLGKQGGFSRTEVTAIGIAFLVGAGIACMTAGWTADRFGRQRTVLVGLVLGGLVAFPLFWAGSSGSALAAGLVLFLAGASIGTVYGPEPAYFGELFPTRHRYSGISFGVQISTVIAGATAPILATVLLEWSSGSTWTISAFVIIWQLVGIAGALAIGETRGRRIVDDEPADPPSGDPTTTKLAGVD